MVNLFNCVWSKTSPKKIQGQFLLLYQQMMVREEQKGVMCKGKNYQQFQASKTPKSGCAKEYRAIQLLNMESSKT